MVDNKIVEELRESFNNLKTEFGIKSSFEKVDTYFGISDMVLSDEFISQKFNRSINRRILDSYNSWVQFCHSHLMPQPGNIIHMEESKCISKDDREIMTEILYKIMELSSRNALNGINEDKVEDARFIDDAVSLWEEDIKIKLQAIFDKIHTFWKEKKLETENKQKSYGGVI